MGFKSNFVFVIILIVLATACTKSSTQDSSLILDETQVSKSSISYVVINFDRETSSKCILDIRLQNRISEEEIALLAEDIHEKEASDCSPLYIYYFLPDEKPGIDIAWAYSFFTPQLEVKINGLDLDEEATLLASTPEVSGKQIGYWLNDYDLLSHTISFNYLDGVYTMTTEFTDGSGETKNIYLHTINGEERYYQNPEYIGVYYVVRPDGNLALFDNLGLIYSIKPVK